MKTGGNSAKIRLEKLREEMTDACVALTVSEAQKKFVAPNAVSLIHAYFALSEGRMIPMPYAVFCGEEMVGFLMLAFCKAPPEDPDAKDAYCIWRLMIDKDHQGRGYGKSTVEQALRLIRTFPLGQADRAVLFFEPENLVAKRLYESFGFRESGNRIDGETELVLKL